jgi:hypothetical protein
VISQRTTTVGGEGVDTTHTARTGDRDELAKTSGSVDSTIAVKLNVGV